MMKYDLNWVKEKYETEARLKYLFFWGHQPKKDESVGKGCLSQWWKSEFRVEGIMYQTAEHWMMAEKARLFGDEEALLKILESKSPAEAKKLGRQVTNFDEDTWKSQRYEIVKAGNRHKFNQNLSLKEYLMATKNRIIVEASPYDKIWGIGLKADVPDIENPFTWKGLNLLGFAIMEVRDEMF